MNRQINNGNNNDILRGTNPDYLHVYDNRFTKVFQTGHTTTLNSTLSDINDSGNSNWLMPATATTLDLVSTSSQDGVSGTGIQLILIRGLGQSFEEIQETIALNGTDVVTTINSYRAMNLCVSILGGTIGSGAVGEISISSTTDDQVWGKYIVNDTTAEVGRYTIPKSKKLLGTHFWLNAGKDTNATVIIEVSIPGRLPISFGETYVSQGFFNFEGAAPFLLNQGETIKLRGYYNSGGSGARRYGVTIIGQLASETSFNNLKSN